MDQGTESEQVEKERWRALRLIEAWLERPMIVLSLVWLVLFVVELTRGLSPFLRDIGTLIWAAFVFDFLLRIILAPRKLRFMRRNVLTAVSLALPALRLFRAVRVIRVLQAGRHLRLVRVLGTLNRGLAVAGKTMRRRGLGYVLLLSLLVVVLGAAGMYGLERAALASGGFDSYATSLWWTSRIVMTIGPDFWPVTPEGRLLALVLAIYGYATFGYVTASLASLFIDRDAANAAGEVASQKTLTALHREIRALREELTRR